MELQKKPLNKMSRSGFQKTMTTKPLNVSSNNTKVITKNKIIRNRNTPVMVPDRVANTLTRSIITEKVNKQTPQIDHVTQVFDKKTGFWSKRTNAQKAMIIAGVVVVGYLGYAILIKKSIKL